MPNCYTLTQKGFEVFSDFEKINDFSDLGRTIKSLVARGFSLSQSSLLSYIFLASTNKNFVKSRNYIFIASTFFTKTRDYLVIFAPVPVTFYKLYMRSMLWWGKREGFVTTTRCDRQDYEFEHFFHLMNNYAIKRNTVVDFFLDQERKRFKVIIKPTELEDLSISILIRFLYAVTPVKLSKLDWVFASLFSYFGKRGLFHCKHGYCTFANKEVLFTILELLEAKIKNYIDVIEKEKQCLENYKQKKIGGFCKKRLRQLLSSSMPVLRAKNFEKLLYRSPIQLKDFDVFIKKLHEMVNIIDDFFLNQDLIII